MSFFDDASLAFLPSSGAGKDGKAYSIKPTTGDGDFTFSRGSNLAATRVGADGLIEKGRENLLLQSNQFDTTWSLNTTSVTSGQSGYDGTNDAWLLNRLGAFARLEQSISTSGVNTFSIYAKANTLNFLMLNNGTNACWFDLQNGVIGTDTGYVDSKIEPVSGAIGWYRCSVISNTSISIVRVYPSVLDNNITSTTTGSIYIQDAQLEIGLVATDYIETGATTAKAGLLEDEPRFDYSGGATCPSLLLEPSRTNLIDYSEYLGNILNGNRTDINDLVDTSPEGLVNASKLVPTAVFGSHQSTAADYGSFVSGDKITISIFAKANGYDGIYLRYLSGSGAFSSNRIAAFDLSRGRWSNTSMDGTTGAMEGEVGMEALANGWYRCWATATADATGDVDIMVAVLDVTAEDTYEDNFTGDGTKGVLIYGFQLEQGSYPTSYIPNHSGGSVTRGADSCTGAGDVNTFNSTEGVLYFEVAGFENDLSDRYISISDGTSNNAIRVFYYQDSGTTFFRKNVNGAQTTIFSTGDINKSELNKIAVKYNSTNFDIFSNGVKLSTNLDSNSFPINTLSEVNFTNADGVANSFNGKVNQLLTFNTALSDADCIALTTL